MPNRVEKLSLLSEMIAFAKSDDSIKSVEYNFLLAVAQQLEISREDFDYLINNPVNRMVLKSHSERIVQFHRMVLLMHVDQERTQQELAKLYNYGLRMGLNHESITKVLYLMEGFPDMMVPAEVLIDIFKVQYN
ncbi:TerB family tellurite resistance protein [Olleya sp. UBA1516]|mgnify:CR=1 FL=1|uniref:TerB family tellurite resistance protein n=1 Tax=Olleya sp. UBA1516 TaxID=1947013 RepID=UPI0025F504F5|nr:TerB family tellurite resistance protein [Olleya sp. UBA1516]|tara:strand:+ start:3453 stop:3854 length:402 start_codon:yes stop_codon:yes gene_type:complete